MTWAVIGLALFGIMLTVILLKESRTHYFWRTRAAQGDLAMIAALLQQEIARWRMIRVPKGTPPGLWHDIQTADLVAVGENEALIACSVEGEYRLTGGRSEELTSPIDAAIRAAAKLCELILYDIPNLRLAAVRVDVYSTFRDGDGAPVQRPILTTTAERGLADDLIWEDLRPHEIIARLESEYEVDARGVAQPIDPGPPAEGMVLASDVPAPPEDDWEIREPEGTPAARERGGNGIGPSSERR